MENGQWTILKKTFIAFILLSIIISCGRTVTPKPMAYYRIDFPEKKYQKYQGEYPFEFEYPVYTNIQIRKHGGDSCWFDIILPRYNGQIHITYRNINANRDALLEDSRSLAYKHTVKADAIHEMAYVNDTTKVYGILYDIKGNTASSVQFYITDSSAHFMRGALYFNVIPNKDSLAPVIEFFRKDILHLIETLHWKKK